MNKGNLLTSSAYHFSSPEDIFFFLQSVCPFGVKRDELFSLECFSCCNTLAHLTFLFTKKSTVVCFVVKETMVQEIMEDKSLENKGDNKLKERSYRGKDN